ncbi:HAD-IA family hydrolase [Haloarculaceae archaeon H-GB1-1]|nr:HAD-IA family hydrolase [Haloarculaceae archaeon H-GB1-1]
MTAEYDAIVYDLDGTLVELDVDWAAVADDVAATLRAHDVTVDGADLWGMLTLADETGHRPVVEDVIAEYEREGARASVRLALADELPLDVPVGVCSLNSERACRIALEVHGIDGHVDALVGRDSVATEKPDPEPLLATVESLSVAPERTLFIGDSERDEETANRAGTAFQYVRARLA